MQREIRRQQLKDKEKEEEETKKKGSRMSGRDFQENKECTRRRPSGHLPGTNNGTEDKLSEKGSVACLSSSKCSSRDVR